jgi:hypothetical protein
VQHDQGRPAASARVGDPRPVNVDVFHPAILPQKRTHDFARKVPCRALAFVVLPDASEGF